MAWGLNKKTAEHLIDCIIARDAITGPRIGDVVYTLNGERRRIAHVWGDGDVQLESGVGSFALSRSGSVSYSGGLDPSIKIDCKPFWIPVPQYDQFWVCRDGLLRAGCSVTVNLDCRAFKEIEQN